VTHTDNRQQRRLKNTIITPSSGINEQNDITNEDSKNNNTSSSSSGDVSICTMIILGSGGHTGEMLSMISCIDRQHTYTPTIFIAADNDTNSIPRVNQMLHIQDDDKMSMM